MYSCPTQRLFCLALLLSPAHGLAIHALSSAATSTQPSIPGKPGVGDVPIPDAPSSTLTPHEHFDWESTNPKLIPSASPDTTNPPPHPTLLTTHDSLKPRHPPIPFPLLTPRHPQDNNDDNTNTPLGVKIGLGVGIPFAVVFFSYFCCKCHCRPAQRHPKAKGDGKRTADGRRLALPISNSNTRGDAYPLTPLPPSSVPAAAVHFGPPPLVPPPAYGEEGGGGVYRPLEGEVGYYPPPAAPPAERVRTPPPVYRPSVEAGRSPLEGEGVDGLEVVGRGEGR